MYDVAVELQLSYSVNAALRGSYYVLYSVTVDV